MKFILLIAIAACVCTAISGIMHLTMVRSLTNNASILFFVAGIAQIFWVLPTIRNWDRVWDYIGIAGTIILILLFFITRMPGNPITGKGFPIGGSAIYLEVLQIAFVILLGFLAIKRSKTIMK